ncbi:uncharacterized protein LOC115629608 [Scaptodrosophila lebanonensis]|uniref:Uncharacterized protein LOC115629608 n=1 Tax=Drosophila lebanonensis TaxID=7225 RepID=A0A6J2U0T2_DROLE|nr:uncharacterized protein LOC115629608 [Scaptodrosophila lebanonensis]
MASERSCNKLGGKEGHSFSRIEALAINSKMAKKTENSSQSQVLEQALSNVVEHAKRLNLSSVDRFMMSSKICESAKNIGKMPNDTMSALLPKKPSFPAIRRRRCPCSMKQTVKTPRAEPQTSAVPAAPQPPPPPPPPSPRCAPAQELCIAMDLADNLIKEYKQTEQLTNQLLQDALSINHDLLSYWEYQRDIELVREIELESNARSVEAIIDGLSKEYECLDFGLEHKQRRFNSRFLRANSTQTETTASSPGSPSCLQTATKLAMAMPIPKASMVASTQTEQHTMLAIPTQTQTQMQRHEPCERIEHAISNMRSLALPPSLTLPCGRGCQLDSLPAVTTSSCCFRPIMSEYRERVDEVRQLMPMVVSASAVDMDAAMQDMRLQQLRVQCQRNLIFHDMMRFAEEELLQLLQQSTDNKTETVATFAEPVGNGIATATTTTTTTTNLASMLEQAVDKMRKTADSGSASRKCTTVLESGTVGDVELTNKSLKAQSLELELKTQQSEEAPPTSTTHI